MISKRVKEVIAQTGSEAVRVHHCRGGFSNPFNSPLCQIGFVAKEKEGRRRILWWLHENTHCHAGMNYPRKMDYPLDEDGLEKDSAIARQIDSTILYVVSIIKNGLCDWSLAVRWWDWLMNESPYARVFPEQGTAEQCLDRGYVFVDAEYSGSAIVAALVASRIPWEESLVCEAWCKLIDKGTNKNLAFLIAHTANGTHINFNFRKGRTCHVSVHLDTWSASDINDFVFGDYSRLFSTGDTAPYNESESYATYSQGSYKSYYEDGYLSTILSNTNWCTDTGYINIGSTPFKSLAKRVLKTSYMPIDAVCDKCVKELVPKIMKDLQQEGIKP